MKIYTKKGDAGETDLLSKRVKKDDLRIEVNGTIDEVMATILLAKQVIEDQTTLADLDHIHFVLYQMAYEIALASPNRYQTTDEHVSWLEQQIDQFDQQLEKLTKFIQLDQNPAQAWLNLCRVKTRTAERILVALHHLEPLNPLTLQFMNRLSDYFFTLGRMFEKGR